MASVRRNLTEILLEVTSMMIQEICVETVAKYRKKGSWCFKDFFSGKTIKII